MRRRALLALLLLGACKERDLLYCDARTPCTDGLICDPWTYSCVAQCTCPEAPPAGAPRQFVTQRLILPSSAQSFSMDVDGDGRADNQLKAVVGAIASLPIDLQVQLDAGMAAGHGLALLSLRADDV